MCTIPSFGTAIAGLIYNTANSHQISDHVPAAVFVSSIFAYAGLFLGTAMSGVAYFGELGKPWYKKLSKAEQDARLPYTSLKLEKRPQMH